MLPSIQIQSGPSPLAKILSVVTHMTVRNALKVGCHAPHLPWPYGLVEFGARVLLPRPCGNRVQVQLPNCTAQLVSAPGVDPDVERAVLYFHGGGFLTCGPNTHSRLITRLSKFSNSPILAVDYRLAPEHPMNHAIRDCRDAYAWLRKDHEPGQIVFAGDSAGGYLAMRTASDIRVRYGESPAALALMSPLLQLDPGPKTRDTNANSDAMFGPEAFPWLAQLIRRANDGQLPTEPLNWLLPGEIPPTLIHVSGSEILLHDAELAARRLTEVDTPVTLRIWPGQIHVFQIAAPLLPEAERSLKQIGAFIVVSTLRKTNGAKCLTECIGAVQ